MSSSSGLADLELAMQKVYLLFHQFEFRNTRDQDLENRAKLIGAYGSEDDARSAIARIKDQPGFREFPEGFVIDAYTLNHDNWSQGFIGWEEALGPSEDAS